eukprot:TRINITY_DN4789_c0_g1_i3.p2 TRINITY_DN4789_c0_g1~~TRINITY_DN4789_c0_g1_i3.p2  ORF type:complete len:774 (-),score=54.52 TRINITY_DN4789_c0_g1_i3:3276-5561(-)
MSMFDEEEEFGRGGVARDLQRPRWRECRRDLTDFIRFNLESHPHRSGCPFSVLKQFFPWGRYNVEFSLDFLRRSQALKVDEYEEMVHLLPQADEVLFRTWGEKLLKVKVSSPWFKSIAPGQTRVLTFSVRNYSNEIRTLVACYIEEDQLNIFSLWGEFGKADQHYNKVIQPGRTDVRVQLQCKAPYQPPQPFLSSCIRFVFQERPGPGRRIHVVKIVKVPVNFNEGDQHSPLRQPSPWNVAEDAEVHQDDYPVGLTLADRKIMEGESDNNAPKVSQFKGRDTENSQMRRSVTHTDTDTQAMATIVDKWDGFSKAANRGLHQQQTIVTENGVLTYVLHGVYDFEDAPVSILRALVKAPLNADNYRIKMLALLLFEAQSLKKTLVKKRMIDQIPINQITVHGATIITSDEENCARWRFCASVEEHPILQEICDGDLVFVGKSEQKHNWQEIQVCQIKTCYSNGFLLEGVAGCNLKLVSQINRCCLHIAVLTGRHPLTHNCRTMLNKGFIQNTPLARILFPQNSLHLGISRQKQQSTFQWSSGISEEQKQCISEIINGSSCNPCIMNDTSGQFLALVECVVQILRNQPECSILICGPANKSLDQLTTKLINYGQTNPEDVLRLLSQSTQMGSVPRELAAVASSVTRDAKIVVCTCMVAARMQNRSERSCTDFSHIFFVDAHLIEEPLTFQVMSAVVSNEPSEDQVTSIILHGFTDKLLTFGYSKIAAQQGLAVPFIQRIHNWRNGVKQSSHAYSSDEDLDYCYE